MLDQPLDYIQRTWDLRQCVAPHNPGPNSRESAYRSSKDYEIMDKFAAKELTPKEICEKSVIAIDS
jgi:hypothetical protein